MKALLFIYYLNWHIGTSKYVILIKYFAYFVSVGENHSQSFPIEQMFDPPHSHLAVRKYTFIILHCIPFGELYQPQFIVLSCNYFWLFQLRNIFLLFVYFGRGVIQEVGSTSVVRPCATLLYIGWYYNKTWCILIWSSRWIVSV